ncbi:MAG TPA: hypothetical protein VEO93_10285 [Gemmatimonadales bacterium]|nr:hypothetical protein [Gemmatimonadales bacterium]
MRLTLIPRRRRDASVAALLLVLQALAGGVVALAHAGERTSAPVAIESHHDAHCLVLHDELRCALCQYASAQVVAGTVMVRIPGTRPIAQPVEVPRLAVVVTPVLRDARPRAPPPLSA